MVEDRYGEQVRVGTNLPYYQSLYLIDTIYCSVYLISYLCTNRTMQATPAHGTLKVPYVHVRWGFMFHLISPSQCWLSEDDLTLYLSVHWGASQEQTSTWITESLRQHDQSLPVVWLIFTNISSKCDRCKIGVDILRRNWVLTFKVYTRTPLEVDCGWSLPWVEILREIKDKNLWGRRICSLPSSTPLFHLDREHPTL